MHYKYVNEYTIMYSTVCIIEYTLYILYKMYKVDY